MKNSLENDAEINDLKKKIVRAKNEGRILDHKKLLEQYNNHPLVLNFSSLEREVKEYLREISEILN